MRAEVATQHVLCLCTLIVSYVSIILPYLYHQTMLEENRHVSGKQVGLHGWGVGQICEDAWKVNICTIYQENV